ncbi:hypothetical protein U2053_14625, partial [Listeria monocytogenes]|uniref:hypothetical protein n=1 Tax=Listeria monocytogenes TaxID=1639 RepID=UPI002FDC41CD
MNMEKIRKLFSDDSYLLQNVILELNSWYGVFEDLVIHEHDSSFYEIYFPDSYEAIKSFYFGPDRNNI